MGQYARNRRIESISKRGQYASKPFACFCWCVTRLVDLPSATADSTEASGDIRNVVRTVNGLPSDYAGEINILLNDREPVIVLRNIVLLILLGTISGSSDNKQAAELALHYWYSAFVPAAYNLQMKMIMSAFCEKVGADDGAFSYSLGARSSISGELEPIAKAMLVQMLVAQYQIGDATNELHRVLYVSFFQFPGFV